MGNILRLRDSGGKWVAVPALIGEKGDKGDTGAAGVSCTHSWNSTKLTVTSASGTSSADLKGEKGEKGDKGDPGDGANVTIDSALSSSSTNPVQNKVVNTALGKKLDKLTYEYSKELSCGSDGKVCLGVFGVYDTNITISISSTTSATYNATLVIATQNYFIKSATVYGDAKNVVMPLLTIVASDNTSGSNYYRKLSVYANFPGWSKNIVSVKVVNPYSAPTNILTSAASIPTANLYTPTNDIKSAIDAASSGSVKALTTDEINAICV